MLSMDSKKQRYAPLGAEGGSPAPGMAGTVWRWEM